MKTGSILVAALEYAARFLLIGLGITLAGALVGACLFVVVGSAIGMDLSTTELLRNGLFDGGFLALIWAPGAAFVMVLIHANRKRTRAEVKKANGLDSLN